MSTSSRRWEANPLGVAVASAAWRRRPVATTPGDYVSEAAGPRDPRAHGHARVDLQGGAVARLCGNQIYGACVHPTRRQRISTPRSRARDLSLAPCARHAKAFAPSRAHVDERLRQTGLDNVLDEGDDAAPGFRDGASATAAGCALFVALWAWVAGSDPSTVAARAVATLIVAALAARLRAAPPTASVEACFYAVHEAPQGAECASPMVYRRAARLGRGRPRGLRAAGRPEPPPRLAGAAPARGLRGPRGLARALDDGDDAGRADAALIITS